MTKNKYSKVTDLNDIFGIVKVDMNKELRENGLKPISIRPFKIIVKAYMRNVYERVIYKYEYVSLWLRLGVFYGHKIMCTKFNPHKIDVNKTDGYFYFILWQRPYIHRLTGIKIPSKWKKKQFKNVVERGGDYPEVYANTYR